MDVKVETHGCREELGGEKLKVVDEGVCRAEGDTVDAEEGVEKGMVELVDGVEAAVSSAEEGEEEEGEGEEGRIAYP